MNERQSHIIAAAIPLFLTDGVSVPTARIAKAAGVSNGSLFNAFPTKQDLIDAIYLRTKIDMFDAMPDPSGGPLDRAHLHQNWQAYLTWARNAPQDHKVMHLLRDAGLASETVTAQVDEMAAPYAQALSHALEGGVIRGPTLGYVSDLIFAQIDLVIDHTLTGADEALAFDMLCNTLGLTK